MLVACEPVDFRKGIDSLACVCRQQFQLDPFLGTLFVFRNRSGTALKLLVYDGQGFWLCQKRFSKGRLQWWPRQTTDGVAALPAEQLAVLIYNGLPLRAGMAEPWRRVGWRFPTSSGSSKAATTRVLL